MKGIRSIVNNTTSAYQFYQLVRTGTMILISILLVKTGFNRADVSSFELFLFIVNLLSFFWVMGIKNATLSYYPGLKGKDQNGFFFQAFLLLQGIGLLFAVFYLATMPFALVTDALVGSDRSGFLLAIYLFLYAPTVLVEVLFILKDKAKNLILYGAVIHVIQLFSVAVTAIFTKDIASLFLVLLGWMLVKWLFALYIIVTNSALGIKPTLISKFAIFSAPIILHILLGNGMEFLDGMLVNRFFDPDKFALYRYGARELPFVLILISALTSTMIPAAVRNVQKSASEVKRKTRRLMNLFYPLSIALLFMSPFLYRFFYSDMYLESALLFNIYLLILSSRIILAEVFIYASHQNRLLMYVSGAELILNILLSILLLQYFGLAGIAFATVIAFLSSKLYLVIRVWKKIGLAPGKYLDVRLYLFYTAALYLAFLTSTYLLQTL